MPAETLIQRHMSKFYENILYDKKNDQFYVKALRDVRLGNHSTVVDLNKSINFLKSIEIQSDFLHSSSSNWSKTGKKTDQERSLIKKLNYYHLLAFDYLISNNFDLITSKEIKFIFDAKNKTEYMRIKKILLSYDIFKEVNLENENIHGNTKALVLTKSGIIHFTKFILQPWYAYQWFYQTYGGLDEIIVLKSFFNLTFTFLLKFTADKKFYSFLKSKSGYNDIDFVEKGIKHLNNLVTLENFILINIMGTDDQIVVNLTLIPFFEEEDIDLDNDDYQELNLNLSKNFTDFDYLHNLKTTFIPHLNIEECINHKLFINR